MGKMAKKLKKKRFSEVHINTIQTIKAFKKLFRWPDLQLN